jgi:hypothetical protein
MLGLILARLWCAIVGHDLDENSVHSEPYVLRHCTRCNGTVRLRM